MTHTAGIFGSHGTGWTPDCLCGGLAGCRPATEEAARFLAQLHIQITKL